MPSSDIPKRKASDAPVSPPPLKRKLQSGTTTNFFTPASQKPKDPTVWSERSPNDDTPATLLVGRFDGVKEDRTIKRRKIAAFDLDSTLISTASGKKHASSGTDWKWWDNSVPAKLRELYQDGYRVVILSNQAGLTLHFDPKSKAPKATAQKRVTEFKQKCSAVLNSLNLPTCVYAATEHDIYRKPRTGMWKELCDDYDISESEIDLGNSVFVGDAGGRTATLGKGPDGVAAAAKDFSCSDRNFAHNVGIQYQTPEEFFLGQKPRSFAREFDLSEHPFVDDAESGNSVVAFDRTNDKDIILFCGPPGAGKSTFYWKSLKPLGYERINQDQLKTRDKCVQAAREHLQAGKSIAI
ncbi:bifunctional polynucleotide phosphatase kinase, partial [Fusarium napiforme]